MSNKKSLGCFAYAFFSIVILILIITAMALCILGTLSMGWFYIIVSVSIIFWVFISAKISKQQQANLPIVQSKAILIEKTQNNARSGSTYFLTFALEDESRKIFKVDLNVYAALIKNEKGLLKYKHANKKIDHYLSYRFVGFEKQDN